MRLIEVQLFHCSQLQLNLFLLLLVGGYLLVAMPSQHVTENLVFFLMEKIWKKYLFEGHITQVWMHS